MCGCVEYVEWYVCRCVCEDVYTRVYIKFVNEINWWKWEVDYLIDILIVYICICIFKLGYNNDLSISSI